ncbi:hypothetical protein N802_18035 [Knoellia sinensis KCTC 19936]|uniref:Secreted protein n=1 Tax=Knoellia sinensis KCTC 19936 TaxID=1385520 RepID=A0A0A0J4X2_9MICO|nr:hypothetical protein [Knoellia sinensis]KGN32263.1 hypothetical protein N802_18035 [Knoellia sinensis KCTC 19936]
MRTSTTTRRAAGILATTAVAGLLTVSPAFAKPDSGGPIQPGGTTSTLSPADVKVHDSSSERRVFESEIIQKNLDDLRKDKGSAPAPGPAAITLPDSGVNYLQIGLGALGGMAAAGALAAAVSVRHHRHAAHPA